MLTRPRQQALTSKNAELEALEARLRAAEERLKEAKGTPDGEESKSPVLQPGFEHGGAVNQKGQAIKGDRPASKGISA